MMSLMEMIIRLDSMGLTDLLLPFLLIFSVIFAIVSNVKILGEKKNVHLILALSISLLVVVPHMTGSYPPGMDVVEMMNSAIPNVTGVVVAAIMFLILIGVFGIRPNLAKTGMGGFVVLLSAIIIFIIFGSSAGWFDLGLPSWLNFLNDPDMQSLIVVILMCWAVISIVTATPRAANEDPGFIKFLNFVGNGFNEHPPQI